KLFRIVVDGEAEQDELDERHAEHHGEGDAIPPHLDGFLGDQRPETPEREEADHRMLSWDCDMTWMKTSSRLVSPSVTVAASKDSANRAIEAASAARSRPTTCSVLPKGATWSTPSIARRYRAMPAGSV